MEAECPSLKYGETITIRFKCQASADSNGQEWENIVTATADNLINPETGEQNERIWQKYGRTVHSFRIDKTADKYEWQMLEQKQVAYRIVVNNVTAEQLQRCNYY